VKANRKRLVQFIAILVIALSLISITHTVCGRSPKRDYRASESLGRLLAEQTSKLLNNKGNVVVLAGAQGSQRVQLNSLKQALQEKSGMSVVAVIEPTTRDIGLSAVRGQVPWKIFQEAITKYPDVSTIVSLLGPPQLSQADYENVSNHLPNLVVFAPMGMGIKELLEDGIVQIAVVPRTGLAGPVYGNGNVSKPASATSSSAQNLLESQYQILTPHSDLTSYIEPSPPPLPPAKT